MKSGRSPRPVRRRRRTPLPKQPPPRSRRRRRCPLRCVRSHPSRRHDPRPAGPHRRETVCEREEAGPRSAGFPRPARQIRGDPAVTGPSSGRRPSVAPGVPGAPSRYHDGCTLRGGTVRSAPRFCIPVLGGSAVGPRVSGSPPRLIGPDPRSSFRPSTDVSRYGPEKLQSTLPSRLIQHLRGPSLDSVRVSLSCSPCPRVMSNGAVRNSVWRIPHPSRHRSSQPTEKSSWRPRLCRTDLCCSPSRSIRLTGHRRRSRSHGW